MLVFMSEIPVVTTQGDVQYHSGPLIKAESFLGAEAKAKRMNPDLEVVGEYVSMTEVKDELELL